MKLTARSTTLAALLSLSLFACGGGNAPPPEAPKAETHAHSDAKPSGAAKVAPGDAKPGDTTSCPVSGEEFVVDASSPHVEHGGKTYYFCCAGCKKKFESDPAKFTAPKT